MLTASDIVSLAERYAAAFDPPLPMTTVSYRVFADTKKLAALRDGGDLTLSRAAAAVKWFSAHWPAGLEWPGRVTRCEDSPIPPEAAE